ESTSEFKTSNVSSPGTPKIHCTPSFSRQRSSRSDPFMIVPLLQSGLVADLSSALSWGLGPSPLWQFHQTDNLTVVEATFGLLPYRKTVIGHERRRRLRRQAEKDRTGVNRRCGRYSRPP